jgi:hypothetical protein
MVLIVLFVLGKFVARIGASDDRTTFGTAALEQRGR